MFETRGYKFYGVFAGRAESYDGARGAQARRGKICQRAVGSVSISPIERVRTRKSVKGRLRGENTGRPPVPRYAFKGSTATDVAGRPLANAVVDQFPDQRQHR